MNSDLSFDLEQALCRVDQDADFLCELVTLFFRDYSVQMSQLREACVSRDATLVCERAHAIKSPLGNLGAMRAHGAAYELEKSGRKNDLNNVDELIAKLELEVTRFRESFDLYRTRHQQ